MLMENGIPQTSEDFSLDLDEYDHYLALTKSIKSKLTECTKSLNASINAFFSGESYDNTDYNTLHDELKALEKRLIAECPHFQPTSVRC